MPLALLATVCGCSGLDYGKRVKSWIGAPVEELISVWGAPRYTKALKDGRRSYSWVEEHEEWVAPDDPWDADGHYDPSERLERYTCTTVVIADPSGIVMEAKDEDPPFFTECWRFAAPRARVTPTGEAPGASGKAARQ